MENKKLVYFVLVVLFAAALILGVIILFIKNPEKLEVSFLNVGQGDAILIESGQKQVLIDSGKNSKLILEKLGEKLPFWDRKIELVIITHPDFDHYGGFGEVFKNYKVEGVIKTNVENDALEWQDLKDKMAKENVELIEATAGTVVNFPNGAQLQLIYPLHELENDIKDKNDASIVTRLKFGENEFLFTGDLSLSGEKEILDSGLDISADVLKVGHHGSHSSTSDEFLEKVNPKDAVISVGKGNSYGHPHKEIIEKLKNKTIRIWRTDEDGSIDYTCPDINQPCNAQSF